MTTFAMDRRGFGASGDAAGYALEPEFEDVAAVVEAVAARTGGPVALWGHSYGPTGQAPSTGSAPTLLLAGSESHPVLRQATDRALAAIPGARVRALEGHAHLAHRSDPAMVAAVIRAFVSGSAAASGARPGARTRPG